MYLSQSQNRFMPNLPLVNYFRLDLLNTNYIFSMIVIDEHNLFMKFLHKLYLILFLLQLVYRTVYEKVYP